MPYDLVNPLRRKGLGIRAERFAKGFARAQIACISKVALVLLGHSQDTMKNSVFLKFRSCSTEYGLPVEAVVEIIRIVALQPVPDPTPDLVGMINLRGQVLPVFDLCRTLALGDRPLTLRMYIIIAEVSDETIGLLVDDVLDVVQTPDSQYRESSGSNQQDNYTAGVIRNGSELLTILNLRPYLERSPEGLDSTLP